jgi:hypothetical protein
MDGRRCEAGFAAQWEVPVVFISWLSSLNQPCKRRPMGAAACRAQVGFSVETISQPPDRDNACFSNAVKQIVVMRPLERTTGDENHCLPSSGATTSQWPPLVTEETSGLILAARRLA